MNANQTAPHVSSTRLPVSYSDIIAAHEAIRGQVIRTPCLHAKTLSEITGAEVWLKFENLQFTAAYKERGALNKLLSLNEEQRQRGVIAASAGNHSQGLSYHAARLGIPTTIVMPITTPLVKISQTKGHGATVELFGENFDEAHGHALTLEAERNLTFVHPFDDPHVIAGQGTVAVEMLEDMPDLDMLCVPIGGGGLISGCSIAAKHMKPDIEVIGVQAALYPSMYGKLKGESMICEGDSLAEGISVKAPGEFTFQIVEQMVDDIVLVAEAELERSVAMLLGIEKTVVEGAGAAGLAALLTHPDRFRGRKVGLPLCGGNIDTRLLANVLLRDLARDGRLARLRIRLKDRPGQLMKVTQIFLEHQVNILEVSHQRIFSSLPAKGLITDVECETRDGQHLERLLDGLRGEGFDVSMVELA
ncbi:threonine ammonia-lyase [Pacificimonas sp. ICDLI1SI03]